MVGDKRDKKAVVVDVTIPSDSEIKKKEGAGRMWGVKASVVPVLIGALGVVTTKLGEWLQ